MSNRTLLYDTFNARYLTYQQVADSFITNAEFNQLQGNNSILLMGPRGCGKTTLLKMLTPAGLHYWNGIEAEQYKREIQFTAIYIPSDIQWKNQIEYLSELLKNQIDFNEVVTQFLFATNIQIALCKTFNSVIDFKPFGNQEKLDVESNVCKSLIEHWQIERPITATFNDIEIALLKRVSNINRIINEAYHKYPTDNLFKHLPTYVFVDFFDLVKIGCKVFEQKLKLDLEHKWALCFDELEIAPKYLQIKLVKYLRSVDQKYLFKLTTTPLFNLENNIVEATQGNDFSAIKLWVYDESGLIKWQLFCQKLILSRLEKGRQLKAVKSAENVFGRFSLDDIIKEELNGLDNNFKEKLNYHGISKPGTGAGSTINYLFKYLALIDLSFKNFIKKRGLDPNDPYAIDELQSKSIFLKYKLDAVYRMVYMKRGRRTPHIHFGLPYIYDICDGNPRLVIGLIDEILKRSNFYMNDDLTIDRNKQSLIIFEASEKYFNLIQNHPDSTIIVNNDEFNLADDILRPIGDYMNNKIVQDEFAKTSPSTFIIDDEINQKLVKLLESALYLGAIVYLDPIESLSNTGIIGKRFRLSSFLTPKFKIPNRISSQVKLSTILKIEYNKSQMQIDYRSDDNN